MATLDLETALSLKILASTAIEDYGIEQVYPSKPPLIASKPSISYILVSAADTTTHDSTAVGELVQAVYQFDCWADSQATAQGVAQAVYKALYGFKGTVTATNGDTRTFGGIARTGKRLNYETVPQVWWISQDFAVWYSEV